MPPISYSSIEEAWGIPKNNKEQTQCNEQPVNKFDKLNENSIKERNNVIDNMNFIERNSKSNNPDPERYRLSPMNNISPLKSNILNRNNNIDNKTNDRNLHLSGFDQHISIENNNDNKSKVNEDERQSYKDRLLFLEKELEKCKNYLQMYKKENNKENLENTNIIESFQNVNSNTGNDIIDIVFLIIIGLVIIFIMNSIFKLGKSVGSR